MNKLILLMLCTISFLYALNFNSYEDALKIQKKNGKIIMLDVMRSDCYYCSKMEEEVFSDEKMSTWLQDSFIPAEINLDFDELPVGLNIYVTPSFFFIDKNNKIVKKIVGAWSIEDFKDLTKNIK